MTQNVPPAPRPVAGPIAVSANGRHFVDAAGRPFFWLADTAWPLFTLYPPEAARAYLADRAARGFAVIQGVLGWGQPDAAVSLEGSTAGPNPHGELPWRRTPAEPNPAFFDYADELLDFAGERGLHVLLMPMSGYQVNQARAFTPESAYAYGRWLGERYRDRPNVLWMNGGDREPFGFEEVWLGLARGLRDGDGGRHLITYHTCGWHSSSYYFHAEPWLDFNMIQTWTAWDQVHAAVSADYAMLPPKPTVLGEPAYEDGPEYPRGPITPLVVRRQAWWTHTAGGSFSYGQNQMWRMEPGWLDALGSPGARHMTVFRRVAESRPWWRMIPDQGLYGAGVSSERTLNTAMRAVDRSCALLYLSSQCHVLVNVDRIVQPRVRATWVDPRTGDERDAGTYATGNGTGSTFPEARPEWFSVPGQWEDAVLLLDGVEG